MWIYSSYYYQGTDFGIWFGRAREVRTSRYETPSQKVGRPVLCDEVELRDTGRCTKGALWDPLTSATCCLLEMMEYSVVASFGFSTKLHCFTRAPSDIKIALFSLVLLSFYKNERGSERKLGNTETYLNGPM